ncbi:L,D-transpeptidase [Pectinatus sottacetonis]|uniref:L,D-transpeptidase n=1 Tax=Pectinatus sottacetonis TaxID=1002795 RepID=UPI0018C5E469|nr:L,D-transpeptidase [Pectinatus sottacetonis]
MMRYVLIIFSTVIMFFTNYSYTNAEKKLPEPAPAKPSIHLLVNIPAHWIRIYDNNTCTAAYPVAVGKPDTPTPVGDFKIIYKEKNPTWIDPDDTDIQIPSGPENPIGYRWIGIGGNYGIHGTNRPDSIGKYASNGCIRVNEKYIEMIYRKVSIGTPVKIIYNRLIVEKAANGNIAYYIYPDGYDRQPLTVQDVDNSLQKFHVTDFADENSIAEQINMANGLPNYVAFPIKVKLENITLPLEAVKADNIIYIPVRALSKFINLSFHWDAKAGLVSTTYGQVPGIIKGSHLYINVLNIEKLFNLQRDWQQPNLLVLRVMKGSSPAAFAAAGLPAL